MDAPKVIESVFVATLKPRGFRKRALNWFRTTDTGLYQVVNLQRSAWGGGGCYLNLGWDPEPRDRAFLPENHCMAGIRAEYADVMPAIDIPRPDGVSVVTLPGISLLDSNVFEQFAEEDYRDQVREVVARPVADLMDCTRSMADLVPLFSRRREWAMLKLRDHLHSMGLELPEA